MKTEPYTIKAVLFDFDGTLTRHGAIDYAGIRAAIGCPAGHTLLEFIHELPDPDGRSRAMSILHRMEMEGARRSRPNDGAEDAVAYVKRAGLPVGILTRNSREAVACAFDGFETVRMVDFDILITRDDPVAPKPSPEGVHYAAASLGVEPSEVLVVGDVILDIQAGQRAGALTAYLARPDASHPLEADFVLSGLSELPAVVRGGLPLPIGKFPSDLLAEFFGHLSGDDPSILIRPSIGEDTAAVDLSGEDTLVLTSDPITFITGDLASYTVLVNANDIATSGAVPRWMLTTLLFPPGSTPSTIRELMHGIRAACDRLGITLCGGHTEITDAVIRPVVTGMMVGTVRREGLVDKRRMAAGDAVLLTKAVAVEGTAIIANAFSRRLDALGMAAEDIRECREFVNHLSIVEEARLAVEAGGVSAMHDVTEGGLATALVELSVAGGHRLSVSTERIPVYPQTASICRLLGIDPLGLIGSGSLIICCRPEAKSRILKALTAGGIAAADIGEVLEPGKGIAATRDGRPVAWPTFEVDEITRLFSG